MNRDTALAGIHSRIGEDALREVAARLADSVDVTLEGLRELLAGTSPGRALEDPLSTVPWGQIEQGLRDLNVQVLTMGDAGYPASLQDIRQPPPVLYVIGSVAALDQPGIGICGSRNASSKDLEYARAFGAKVARLGLPEVSGYARGVDTEAHLGALEAGGTTVIVLAEGILHFRLKQVFRAIEAVRDRITVVSEFHPGRPWQVASAMRRNRTICALSRGVVVVEARETGGTLDAGKECLRQGKPLLVVQHGQTENTPGGNLQLIRAGGVPVTSLRDLERRLSQLKSPLATPTEVVPEQLPLVAL